MSANQLDEATLLSAILSGGVIGGAVSLADRGLDRAKYAVPLGMAFGIFLDYQLKKRRNKENIEVAKGYFETLARYVTDIDPSNVMDADTNAYWSTLTFSLASIATIALSAGGMQAFFGYFTTAAIPPRLLNLPADAIQYPIQMPTDALPVVEQIPLADVGYNPVNAVFNPITLQLMAAFAGGRAPVRHAGTVLATQVVSRAVVESGLVDALVEAASSSIIRETVESAISRFVDTLVNGLDVVEQGTMLTNERLLLINSFRI